MLKCIWSEKQTNKQKKTTGHLLAYSKLHLRNIPIPLMNAPPKMERKSFLSILISQACFIYLE